MGVFRRFWHWRNLNGSTFEDAPVALTLREQIDAADYELQCIVKDIALVCSPNWGPFPEQRVVKV